MSKLRFYQYLSLALLAGNLSLLWLHFSEKKPRHDGPRNEIIQRLHLDEAQVKQYDALIQQHRKSLFALEDALQQQRKALYSSMDSEALRDTLLESVAHTQRAIEQLHYAHFQDIRALCTPVQMPLFEQLTRDLASMFGKGKRGEGRPKP